MATLVWAFQKLPELDNQVEFVWCDDALAEQLIKSGKAQDPRVGAFALKHVQAAPAPVAKPQEYATRDMTARPRTMPRR